MSAAKIGGLVIVSLVKGVLYIVVGIIRGSGNLTIATTRRIRASKDLKQQRQHERNVRELTALQLERERLERRKDHS